MSIARIVVIAGLAISVPARAQTLEVPPDVVITHEGGMFRGVIVEHIPGERVVIRIAPDETREFPAAEVRFAGPAADALTSPIRHRAVPVVDLRLESAPSGLMFHRATHVVSGHPRVYRWHSTSEGQWARFGLDRMCRAPCEFSLEPGEQRFALAPPLGAPRLTPPVQIEGPGTLQGELALRGDLRVAGGVLMVAGPILGLVLALIPPLDPGGLGSEEEPSIALVASGFSMLALSFTIGAVLVGHADYVAIRFVPDRP